MTVKTAVKTSPRTNADMVAPAVDRLKGAVALIAAHCREHPDEVAVGMAPWLMLTAATRRHHLNFAEAMLISECAVWSGFFAAQAYRAWKDKPAGTVPALRKVT